MPTSVPRQADLSNQVTAAFRQRRTGRRKITDLHAVELLRAVASREHVPLTNREVSDLLICSIATARRTINRTLATGLLRVDRSGRVNAYSITRDVIHSVEGEKRA